MTDNEFKKASECCIDFMAKQDGFHYCEDCPLNDDTGCGETLLKDALNRINLLQAENEMLRVINSNVTEAGQEWQKRYETARDEAFKEFAEELEVRWWESGYGELSNRVSTVVPALIHNLLEEKVGKKKDEYTS